MKRIKCASIGPGDTGSDPSYQLRGSPVFEPLWMVGATEDAAMTSANEGERSISRAAA